VGWGGLRLPSSDSLARSNRTRRALRILPKRCAISNGVAVGVTVMGGGAGGGIGWVGHGHGVVGAFFARRRAVRQTLDAAEAMMKEDGLAVPTRMMSQANVFWIGFSCGLVLGLLAGLVFWELT